MCKLFLMGGKELSIIVGKELSIIVVLLSLSYSLPHCIKEMVYSIKHTQSLDVIDCFG